jgi:hypothetical protein
MTPPYRQNQMLATKIASDIGALLNIAAFGALPYLE